MRGIAVPDAAAFAKKFARSLACGICAGAFPHVQRAVYKNQSQGQAQTKKLNPQKAEMPNVPRRAVDAAATLQ